MRAWKVGEPAFWRGSRSAASPMFPEERRLLTDFWVLVTDVDSNSRLPMRVQATDGFAFDPCADIRCLEPGDVTGAGPTPPRETASFAEAAIAPPGALTPAELQRIQARGGATYVLRDGNIVQLPDGVPAPPGAARGVGTSPPEPRIPELAEGHVDQVRFFEPPAAETDGSEDPEVVDSWHLPSGDAAAGRHVVAIEDGPPAATVIRSLDHAAALERESARVNEQGGVIAFLVSALARVERAQTLEAARALGVVARLRVVAWRSGSWTPNPGDDPADWPPHVSETMRGEAADVRTAPPPGSIVLTGPEAAAYRAFRAASAALEDSHRAFRERQREHLEATAVLGRAATRANDQSDGGP